MDERPKQPTSSEDVFPEQPQSMQVEDSSSSESLQNTDWPELDVRSSEVQEIIGRPPHWLIRWGITFFFAVMGLIFLVSFIIKYPEVIEAPIRLTAIEAPQTLQSRIDGRIDHLLVENNEVIQQGEVIAWMESTADHEEVLQLSAIVDSIHIWLLNNKYYKLETLNMAEFSNLGELQGSFQNFEQSRREFMAYQPGGIYKQRQKMLEQELVYNQQLLANLLTQKENLEQDYEIAESEFEIQKQLGENGFIAPIEKDRAKRELIAQRQSLQEFEASIINNQLSQSSKRQEIMELQRQSGDQSSEFLQDVNSMKSTIKDWNEQYFITAPFDGKVIFTGVIQENQLVNTGQELAYVKPDNVEFFGEMPVAQQSFGKIEEGQKVLVRFNGYPYHEYGSVNGEIEYFSDIPVQDSLFFARVDFPEELTTNYDVEIPPVNGMAGQAEIITQDMRLIDRVYNNLTKELR